MVSSVGTHAIPSTDLELADFSGLTLNPVRLRPVSEIPAPDISSPGVVAVDITERFTSAVECELFYQNLWA